MSESISIQDLTVTYRGGWLRRRPVRALRGVDLATRRGEVLGVLGPNGSGKSTLFGVLAGVLPPTGGDAKVLGHEPHERTLVQRVGYQPEGPLPFPSLPARTFLHYLGDVMGMPRAETRRRAGAWLERLELDHAADRALGTFSTGMSRRLALASALLSEPEVLLLDEPTAGLDPNGSLRVMEVVGEFAERGATVLMASHNLEEVEQACQRVYLLAGGERRAEGTLDQLLGGDEQTFVVRGLDDDGVAAVRRTLTEVGAELVRVGREREHLYALFRRLGAAP